MIFDFFDTIPLSPFNIDIDIVSSTSTTTYPCPTKKGKSISDCTSIMSITLPQKLDTILNLVVILFKVIWVLLQKYMPPPPPPPPHKHTLKGNSISDYENMMSIRLP